MVASQGPLPGTRPATQACALTGNGTSSPLVRRPAFNPLSHTSQSSAKIFKTSPIIVEIKLILHFFIRLKLSIELGTLNGKKLNNSNTSEGLIEIHTQTEKHTHCILQYAQ